MRSPVWIWTGGESATVVGKLSNGPLMPTAALMRFSYAAARGA